MSPREKMIRETETFLERELSKDTIPCGPPDEETALFVLCPTGEELRISAGQYNY